MSYFPIRIEIMDVERIERSPYRVGEIVRVERPRDLPKEDVTFRIIETHLEDDDSWDD